MTILVLVADSAHARMLVTDSQRGSLTESRTFDHPASRLRNQDLTSDGRGSGRDSGGLGRHSMGHERSARQQEELKFAKEVAQVLDDTVDAKISKVYLIAPARFLGLLRPAISANVRQHVAAELDRDLVNLTPEKVREHLPEYL